MQVGGEKGGTQLSREEENKENCPRLADGSQNGFRGERKGLETTKKI